ncbi:TPA: carbohydrate ABC transporter substrate-binding protein [Klebsiella pneumoniae]|nr:carbohydrate ABC transporter substrate-binding protein [Klebsiella pneumoniae]
MNYFKGLTWDHPRGYRPLQAWAKADDTLKVEWDIQKLEGFESHPVDELAEKYDLLIVDNPSIGEAAEKKCLWPLEEFLTSEQMTYLRETSTGHSWESYQFGGKHWAIPVDAASQVCALADSNITAAPASWDDVLLLSKEHEGRVALSLGGPHALLTFYSICQSLGGKLFEGNDFILDATTATQALQILQAVFRRQNKALTHLNPIGLLDEMARGSFDLCPAIFGYVNYSTPDAGRTVKFFNTPHCGDPAVHGSVLGGTGLAVSLRCTPTPELIRHIMMYVSEQVQKTLVVESGGQPANIYAWKDKRANDMTNNFFSGTLDTVSRAYLRPKYHGYIPFQDTSSAIIRDGLINDIKAEDIFIAVKENYGKYGPQQRDADETEY